MKQIKFLATLFAMMLVIGGFTSCSSDDDDSPVVAGLDDFYISVSLSGGGLTQAELDYETSLINATFVQDAYIMKKYKVGDAVEFFDDIMEEMLYKYNYGMRGIEGTLKMVFTLKTTKGAVIKTTVLNVTKDSAWFS